MYEKQLKQLNPSIPHITYDITVSHASWFTQCFPEVRLLLSELDYISLRHIECQKLHSIHSAFPSLSPQHLLRFVDDLVDLSALV
jgi:hypothetical protein